MDVARLYGERFDELARVRKEQVWRALCRDFFQRYVAPGDTVLDLGAGYCEFINQIQCENKIAVDLSLDLPRYAAPGVTTCGETSTLPSETVDVVFASNFFEHLPDKQRFLDTLAEVRRVLRPGGRLLILQPNIRLLNGAYWDFVDHHIPLTERTMVEALLLTGLRPVEVRVRFLPYTTKSRLPQRPWLVRLYLRLPIAQYLFGKQSWIVAVKQ